MSEAWQIIYWPNIAGRAEFIRLMFEEIGEKYTDVGGSREIVYNLVIKGEMGGYPTHAPPVLKKGDFQLSQTPTICKYLGKKFGLYPDNEEDEWHADQVNATVHDYIAEGRLAFHGINPVASYFTQKEETKPYIERFVKERIPRWLKHFEAVLGANNGGQGFVVGSKITYVDLGLMHILRATESQFPEAWLSADYIPLLKAFKERMEARPNIATYLKSDRWQGFEGNSMM